MPPLIEVKNLSKYFNVPAGTLHADRNEGLQRFINGTLLPDGSRDGNGVTDIKIFFQTYSYSGN